jgi:hypothetical protein
MNESLHSFLDKQDHRRNGNSQRSWPTFRNKDFLGNNIRTTSRGRYFDKDDEAYSRLLNPQHIYDEESGDSNQEIELSCRTRRNGPSSNKHNDVQVSETENQNLRRIYYDNPRPLIDYVEWPVNQGDTLESLSLKSGCTISQIKRANNLFTEQDFYALKIIRIPIKKYGILSEILVNTTVDDDEAKRVESKTRKVTSENNQRLTSSSILEANLEEPRSKEENVQEFIQSLDKNLEQLREKINRDSPPRDSVHLPVHLPKKVILSQPDEECGLSLTHVLCLVLIICILVPVMYVILAEEKMVEHDSHHLHAQDHDHQPVLQISSNRN